MLRSLLLSLSLLSPWLALPVAAQSLSDRLVTWCAFDLPPMYILTGPDAGQGTVDQHVRFLQRKLPEYQHRMQFSNIARLTEEMRKKEHVVCAGLQKNAEREQYMLFSEPFLTAQPPQLVTLRSRLDRFRPYLSAAGDVRLSETILQSGLVLGLTAGRSYGRALDDEIARHGGHPGILLRSASENLAEGVLRMMSRGRVDFTLAYASELNQFRAQLPADSKDELITLPIDGQPRYIPIYITAPQNDWGRTFIRRINTLLRKHWDDPEFRRSINALHAGQDPLLREKSVADLREINPNLRR